MNIKKQLLWICITMIMLLSAGCKTEAKGISFPINTQAADAVSIYYGGICYSYYSEKEEDISKTASVFEGIRFEETDQVTSQLTTYEIYFTNAEGQVAGFNVDEKGIFWNAEDKKYYHPVSGTFDMDGLKKMYLDSMEVSGFSSEGQQIPQINEMP